MASVLGNRGIVASRVGNDELGCEACRLLTQHGLSTAFMQKDIQYETGVAGVLLDADGQPKFTIKEPVAWDFMSWTPDWEELSLNVDVVCYGSLAQRSPMSAETIERFLQKTPNGALRICDANLREPFYTVDTLRRSFQYADILKLNDHELVHVASLLGVQGGDEIELARKLFEAFGLKLICITRGANGSVLISEAETVVHPGISVKVADTVGAGDAFTACVAHYYMQGRPLKEISESANRFAAWVATQVGATPSISHEQLADFLGIDTSTERPQGLTVPAEKA